MDSGFENELCNVWGENMKSDILKVAHHGSKYSTCEEFLSMVDPVVSVIQVGNNVYGHPAPEVLERLGGSGSYIYRNDIHGAVMLEFDKKITVTTIN